MVEIQPANLSEAAFAFLHRCFLITNVSTGDIDMQDNTGYRISVKSSDIDGIDVLWDAAMKAKAEAVATKARHLLLLLLLSSSDGTIARSLLAKYLDWLKKSIASESPQEKRRAIAMADLLLDQFLQSQTHSHMLLDRGQEIKLKLLYDDDSWEERIFSNETVDRLVISIAQKLETVPSNITICKQHKGESLISPNYKKQFVRSLRLRDGDTVVVTMKYDQRYGGEPPLCRNRSLLPEARHIMKEIFERFSVEGCMSKAELTAYFAACGVGDSNVSDERLNAIFRKHTTDALGNLTLEGFLEFYEEAANTRLALVWNDLERHGFNKYFENERLTSLRSCVFGHLLHVGTSAAKEIEAALLSEHTFGHLFSSFPTGKLPEGDGSSKEYIALAEEVWSLLGRLSPVESIANAMVTLGIDPKAKEFQLLTASPAAARKKGVDPSSFKINWDGLLDASSPYRLLYSLSIMKGVFDASPIVVTSEDRVKRWRQNFLAYGGVSHLSAILKHAESQVTLSSSPVKHALELKWLHCIMMICSLLNKALILTAWFARYFDENRAHKVFLDLIEPRLREAFALKECKANEFGHKLGINSRSLPSAWKDVNLNDVQRTLLRIALGLAASQMEDDDSELSQETEIVLTEVFNLWTTMAIHEPKLFQALLEDEETLSFMKMYCTQHKVGEASTRVVQSKFFGFISSICKSNDDFHALVVSKAALDCAPHILPSTQPAKAMFEFLTDIIVEGSSRPDALGPHVFEALDPLVGFTSDEDWKVLSKLVLSCFGLLKELFDDSFIVEEGVLSSLRDTIPTKALALVQDILQISGQTRSTLVTEQGAALLDFLFDRCLFDMDACEAILEHNEQQYSQKQLDNEPTLPDPKDAICNTESARLSAYKIVSLLANESESALAETIGMLHKVVSGYLVSRGENYLPINEERSTAGYVGLDNPGCICYMNSLLQQLFMMPPVRASIISLTASDRARDGIVKLQNGTEQQDDRESLLYQLQYLFTFLALSERQAYRPQPLAHTIKDSSGASINIGMQQDAQEFFTTLCDQVEKRLKHVGKDKIFTSVFGGKFVNQLIRQNGPPGIREQLEPFYFISLDVKGRKDVYDSLAHYVSGDLLDDYMWEDTKQKSATLKRQCLGELPDTIILHLKRFEFNFDTFEREKVNDYFEFPEVLDLEPYTKEGLAWRERVAATAPNGDTLNEESSSGEAYKTNPKGYYTYSLVGVLVHMGTAEMGHYYSIIKERGSNDGEGGGDTTPGRWVKFDDAVVTEFDPAELKAECFGAGGDQVSLPKKKGVNWRNAYMLVYERTPNTAAAMEQTAEEAETMKESDERKPKGSPKSNGKSVITQLAALGSKADISYVIKRDNLEFRKDRVVFLPSFNNFMKCITWIVASDKQRDVVRERCKGKNWKGFDFHLRLPNGAVLSRHVQEAALSVLFRYEMNILLSSHTAATSLSDVSATIIEGCQKFLGLAQEVVQSFNVERDRLFPHLLGHDLPGARQAIASMLRACLKTLAAEEEDNYVEEREHGAVANERCLSATLLSIMVKSIPISTRWWRTFNEYYSVIYGFSLLGYKQRAYLFTIDAAAYLVDMICEHESPLQGIIYSQQNPRSHEPMRGDGRTVLLDEAANAACILLRSCQTADPNGDVVVSPYIIDAEHPMKPTKLTNFVMANAAFFSAALKKCERCSGLPVLAAHLSFKNPILSFRIGKIAVNCLQTISFAGAPRPMALLEHMLCVEDEYQEDRCALFLNITSGALAVVSADRHRYPRFAYVVVMRICKLLLANERVRSLIGPTLPWKLLCSVLARYLDKAARLAETKGDREPDYQANYDSIVKLAPAFASLAASFGEAGLDPTRVDPEDCELTRDEQAASEEVVRSVLDKYEFSGWLDGAEEEEEDKQAVTHSPMSSDDDSQIYI